MFKTFLCSLLIFFTGPLCAETNQLIERFFTYLTYIGDPDNPPNSPSLEEYLDNDCTIQSNNKILCQGIDGFVDYIKQMQQKYESVSYSTFLEEPIISEDKVVIHFQVDCLDRTKGKKHLDVVAILTIQKGKIAYWKEVFKEIL